MKKNLDDLKKKKRPSKVVMVVVTDGQENSSREFRKEKIESMVKKRNHNDDWQFVFLSADLAAVTDANAMGFSAKSSMVFSSVDEGSRKVWSTLSKRTALYRSSMAQNVSFEKEDREHPDDPEKKKVEAKK